MISEHNISLFSQLEVVTGTYPVRVERFEALIVQILQDEGSDLAVLSAKCETMLKKLLNFEVDMSSPDWAKQCGLPEERLMALKSVLEIVCGGQASQTLKRSVVISFIENVLECLGVCDLKQIMDIITSQIPRFANQLEESDQLKLQRVINVLLKTLSKTEDYQLRGQLHLALSRFLPFCHDSGFHFRAPAVRASEWESIDSVEEDQALMHGISFEFYEQFWELQKWLIQPCESDGLLTRLRKIEQVLKEVQQYFQNHQAKQSLDYYSQPIKYLKNYNLLALQLGDLTFRKTIMLQVLFFLHSIKHPLAKNPIHLSEADKKVIPEIEAIGRRFLSSCGKDGRKLLEELPKLMAGEQEWVELKEQWKEKKKTVMKRTEEFILEQNKEKDAIKKGEKEVEKARAETKKMIAQKMKIESSKIENFLSNKEPINLQQEPTYTSFSYFYSQAVSCLGTFDREAGRQTEFETRAEYNMFEWKAMRSLYRENIRDIWSNSEKAPANMKNYRLIGLMQRKDEEFKDPLPSKKVKENE